MGRVEDVRGAVHRALTADPLVDAGDIVVGTIGADVLLNGTVPSKAQLAEATVAAQRAAGGVIVHNLLEVALPSADYGDDAALAEIANEALRANRAVPAGVEATVQEGCLTLTGTVRSTAQRSAAQGTAAGVGGVLSITNDIVIQGEGPPAAGPA